ATGDLVDERPHPGRQERGLGRECRATIRRALWGPLEALKGLLDGPLQKALVKGLSDGVEHHLVEPLLADEHPIGAYLRAALVVVGVAVEPSALPGALGVARESHERAAARRADADAAQEVLLAVWALRGPAPVDLTGSIEAPMRRSPQILGHDAKVWRLETEPLLGGPVEIPLPAEAVALALPIPDDLTAVERSEQDLADSSRGPPAPVPWRRHAVLVQGLRDAGEALPLGA